MAHKVTIHFLLRKKGKSLNSIAPIYLRISINARRFEQTTNRNVEVSKWSAGTGRMKGASSEARLLNNYLDALKNKVYLAEREMILDGLEITFQSFKDKWFGSAQRTPTILELFKEHNEEVALLLGKDFAPGTLERYKTSFDHTTNFIKWKYGCNDIQIDKLDYNFISSYALWLKTVRNCNHNTSMKYLANFKKIVLIGLKKGWLTKDPFLGFKITKVEVEKPYLTQIELNNIYKKNFAADRLNLVKDIFVFCCYTGLAYADIHKLKRSEIILGVDGEQWIFTHRMKTDTISRIPLLPIPVELIKKYKDHPQCLKLGKVLPVLTNQKMNAYLKEIADSCSITKNLTFHIARHTFATTVTLANGVPIETVSKMLGHTNLRTTQHYAKILDLKVGEDMQVLRLKLQKNMD